jgi:hypothetical protein
MCQLTDDSQIYDDADTATAFGLSNKWLLTQSHYLLCQNA